MTQALEHIFKRASRLPEAIQDRLARRWLQDLEQQNKEEREPRDEAEAVTFDQIEHLMGSLKGGPKDASFNKKYLEGLGERSLG